MDTKSLYAGVVAFLAVATEGSFARAGDRLGVGRSAVSRSVRRLEHQLGTRLFARTTRNTSLTGEGERFYGSCRPGVEGIVRALEDMRDLRSGSPRGHLRLRSTPDFGRHVIAPLLGGFGALHPDITIDLALDDEPVDFIADRVDVAFRSGVLEDSQLIARQLMPMPLVLCAAPAYLDAHGAPDTLDGLRTHRLIGFRHASGRMDDWEFRIDGQKRVLSPATVLAFNDAGLVLGAVLEGQGMGQLTGYPVREHLRAGRLVACLPAYAPPDRGHFLCYLSRQQMPVRVRVFIDYIITALNA